MRSRLDYADIAPMNAPDAADFAPNLWRSLRSPRETLREFDRTGPALRALPLGTWLGLAAISVGGSLIYGSSLSLAVPGWRPGAGALWMALSAGLAWCVFGPLLILVTRRGVFTCAHACLVTMAYGEGVLLLGAAANVLLSSATPFRDGLPAFNIGVVAASNVVMASALALQLQAVGVPAVRTLLAWMVGLNGSGALFFHLFSGLLGRQA